MGYQVNSRDSDERNCVDTQTVKLLIDEPLNLFDEFFLAQDLQLNMIIVELSAYRYKFFVDNDFNCLFT